MHQIANNREVYLKLREEVKAAEERGAVSDPILFEEALALPYLQMVLKESLRMHPSTGLPMWRVVPAGGMQIAGKFFPPGVSRYLPETPMARKHKHAQTSHGKY